MFSENIFIEKQSQPNLPIQSFQWNLDTLEKVKKCIRYILVTNHIDDETRNFF